MYQGCNIAFLELMNVELESGIRGWTDDDLPWLESVSHILTDEEEVIRTGRARSRIISGRLTEDGVEGMWRISHFPLQVADGKVTGLLGIFEIISGGDDRKPGFDLLSEALQQSPVSIAILDREGRIEYVNPNYTDSTGYALEEMRGAVLPLLRGEPDLVGDSGEIWNVLESGEIWRGEIRRRRKNGEYFWQRLRISPIRGASGRITHYLAIGEDKSETRSLKAQLIQAQKMEAIGQLAGGIAHDFNNLLTVIRGYSSVALEKIDEQNPAFDELTQIRDAGSKAEELTRQLLAFSRRQELQPRVVDLNRLVERMGRMLSRVISENIAFKTDLDQTIGAIRVDPVQMEQVIMNLAMNARDAMPTGGELIISTREMVPDSKIRSEQVGMCDAPYVELAVRDTGTGMSDEVKERIFEPFFTTKSQGNGTGLGLSTVYGIIRQSDGFVQVESTLDEGTVFRVYLPRVDGEEMSSEPESGPERELKGEEVLLVVEDEKEVREFVVRALERFGYTVFPAPDGEQALRIARLTSGKIDLLLTDIIMPGINGPELVTRVREYLPDVTVLYMSGYSDELLHNHDPNGGGVHLLEKPFTADQLGEKLRELLDP